LGSKTIFNPHQFKPLYRFLSSSSDGRIYIADEVGVGKTIESGIIVTELLARGLLDYRTPILIVCPHSLGPKWEKEMRERFRLDFHVHDGKSLRFSLESFLQDGIFPQRYIFSIVGLQLLRHEHYIPLLREIDSKTTLPVFYLIIVDEAHHMRNVETNSNELGNILSSLTEMMLMLSATPLNLSSDDLYNQMHILNPSIFPDKITFETMQKPVTSLNRIRRLLAENNLELKDAIMTQFKLLKIDPLGKIICSHPGIIELLNTLEAKRAPFTIEEIVKYDDLLVSLSPLYHSFTRTRKREALEHQVHREAWEVPINLTDEELQFHNDIIETIKKDYLRRGGNPLALGFVTNMYRRMVSSSIPAMKEYLEWAIRENRIILFDERLITEETEDDSELPITELDSNLKKEFIRLIDEASILENIDSKYRQFLELITKILANPETPQVMVFSFFIRTLEYLRHRLKSEGYKVGIIHGKIPLKGYSRIMGRYEIMDKFEKGEYDILLSSEVGGEGLDFQYCHSIINYDLPYNPMRIEQRIGRIDRFGQKADKIIIANLFILDTVDEEIYDRLYRRIRLVEDGIGSLEPILGDELSNLQNLIISGKLTNVQKEEMSRRLEAAVASAKLQMEAFEKRRRELLSDDYLAKPINRISAGNFVSPDDAIQLTDQCLRRWQGCIFKRTKKHRGEIILSDQIKAELESFLRRPGNEGGFRELTPLLSQKKKIKAVFDGSIANDYTDHMFFSPTGFWTRFLTYKLENEDQIKKTFGFQAKSTEISIHPGEYLVFLFEMKLEGVKTEIDLLSILVDILTKEVIQTKIEFPRILSTIEALKIASLPVIDPNIYFDIARKNIDNILDKKRSEAEKENEFKVESRITALKKSSEIRVKNLQKRIETHIRNRKDAEESPDETYLRLTNARITKENERLYVKIEELKKQRELTIDYSFESFIYLKVIEE